MEQVTVQQLEEAIGQGVKGAVQGIFCYNKQVEQNMRLPAVFLTQEDMQVLPLLGRRKKIRFTYRLTYLTKSERGAFPQEADGPTPGEAAMAFMRIKKVPLGEQGTFITWKKTELTEDKAVLWLEITLFGALEEEAAKVWMEKLEQHGSIKEE